MMAFDDSCTNTVWHLWHQNVKQYIHVGANEEFQTEVKNVTATVNRYQDAQLTPIKAWADLRELGAYTARNTSDICSLPVKWFMLYVEERKIHINVLLVTIVRNKSKTGRWQIIAMWNNKIDPRVQ